MKTVPLKTFRELTSEQKDIIKTLGLKVESKVRKKINNYEKPTAPEEYVLKLISTCRLCESVKVMYFEMKEKDKTHLCAKEIKEEEIESRNLKTKYTSTPTCGKCHGFLAKETKFSLVRRILTLERKISSYAGRR